MNSRSAPTSADLAALASRTYLGLDLWSPSEARLNPVPQTSVLRLERFVVAADPLRGNVRLKKGELEGQRVNCTRLKTSRTRLPRVLHLGPDVVEADLDGAGLEALVTVEAKGLRKLKVPKGVVKV